MVLPRSGWALYEALERMADAQAPSLASLWLDLARHALVRRLFSPVPASPRKLRAELRPWVRIARHAMNRAYAPTEMTAHASGRAIFVVDAPSHHVHAAPIMEALGGEPLVMVFTDNAPWMEQVPPERRLRPSWFDDRTDRARAVKDWIDWGTRAPALRRKLRATLRNIAREHGTDWIAPDVPGAIREELGDRLVPQFFLRRQLMRLLRELRPSSLVTFNEESGARRLSVRVARDLGIPTVHVQHGLFGVVPKFRVPIAEHWLLWGSGFAEMLLELGHRQKSLIVTGPTGFEARLPQPWHEQATERRVLVTALSGVSQLPRPVVERTLRYVLLGLSRTPRIRVVLKPHPDDVTGLARGMAGEFQSIELLAADSSMETALANSDLVVAMVSTTALEAVLAEKPLVLADEDGASSVVDFAREGAAICATNAGEVEVHVKKLISDAGARDRLRERQRAYRERFAWRAEGGGAERVAGEIRRIAGSR
jgi:glycosyltransferase involved in cell wall biosynthesis